MHHAVHRAPCTVLHAPCSMQCTMPPCNAAARPEPLIDAPGARRTAARDGRHEPRLDGGPATLLPLRAELAGEHGPNSPVLVAAELATSQPLRRYQPKAPGGSAGPTEREESHRCPDAGAGRGCCRRETAARSPMPLPLATQACCQLSLAAIASAGHPQAAQLGGGAGEGALDARGARRRERVALALRQEG